MSRSRRRTQFSVSLFPFLSVLLCTMGVLGFLSISFVISFSQSNPQQSKWVEFEWVGAPSHVRPIYIQCLGQKIVYDDIFSRTRREIFLPELVLELEQENGRFLRYLSRVSDLNKQIKQDFGKTEYYPLLLVYPEGILSAELVGVFAQAIPKMTYGMEPMMPGWELPDY